MQAIIYKALKAYMLRVNFANKAEQTDEDWNTISQRNFVSLMTNKFGVRPVYVPTTWAEVHPDLSADPIWQEIVATLDINAGTSTDDTLEGVAEEEGEDSVAVAEEIPVQEKPQVTDQVQAEGVPTDTKEDEEEEEEDEGEEGEEEDNKEDA